MESHGIEKSFLHRCACSLARGKGYTMKCIKESAAGCVAFLVQTMQPVQMNPSALVERRSVDQIVLHRVLDVLTCGTD